MKTPIDDIDDDIYYFRIDRFEDDYKHRYGNGVSMGQTIFVKGKKNSCERLIEEYIHEIVNDQEFEKDDFNELSKYFVMSKKYKMIKRIKPEFQQDIDALAKYHEILKKAEFIDERISYTWGKVIETKTYDGPTFDYNGPTIDYGSDNSDEDSE